MYGNPLAGLWARFAYEPERAERQEAIAAKLIANGHATEKRDSRCSATVELAARADLFRDKHGLLNIGGSLYVKRNGQVRAGYTLADSQLVEPETLRQWLGEEPAAV